jgi:lipoprotein LpqH
VNRRLVASVCGFVVLVTGIAACSSKDPGKPVASSSSVSVVPPPPPPVAAVPNLPPGQAQIVIGGKDTGPTGEVDCSTSAGVTTITIGQGSAGVTIAVTDDAPPTLNSLGIGDLGGVSLGYFAGGADQVPVTTRTGNSYQFTGAGSGTDTTNPAKIVHTTYDISVTCP